MSTVTRPHFAVDESPFVSGTMLVEASAGTGKTFSIAMSVIRLLLERHPDGTPLVDGVGNILVVTFTTAATDELITRIRTLLRQAEALYAGRPSGLHKDTEKVLQSVTARHDAPWVQARITRALAEVDTLAVYTIHSFCKRILDEFALESGTAFGALLLENEGELQQQALQHWWRARFYTDDTLAAFAVASRWSPDAFASAYGVWRRFTSVRVSPDLSLADALAQWRQAIATFAAAYDETAFRQYVGAMDWNSKSPCLAGEALENTVRIIALALAGNLGAARTLGASLGVNNLRSHATKKSGRQKEQAAALDAWPVAQQAEVVGAAVTRVEQAMRVDCFRHVDAWMLEEKRRRNRLGFDDLLASLHRVLVAQGPDGLLARAIRQQFHAALIDEFQDTDRFQFEIFSTAFRGRPLFLIGDPKQAIYAFRGADVHAYLGAVRTADPQYTLATNYRSTGEMVQAVNAVFQRRGQAFVEEDIAFEAASATPKAGAPATLRGTHALHWMLVPPEEKAGKRKITSLSTARALLFAATVRHIATQVGDGWKPCDIAVLVRSRYEGVEIADLLRAHGIPAVVSGLGNVMQSEELLELQVVLEAIAMPRREAGVRAAIATHLWGGDAHEVLQLSQAGSEAQWDTLLAQFVGLREWWLTHGFLQVVQELLRRRQVTERFLSFSDGERRLTNLRHVIELLHAVASDRALNIEGVLRWIRTNRMNSTEELDVRELRLETDADAVRVHTIHKSKGLQFELVYCPTLFAGRPVDAKGPLLVHEHGDVVFDHHEPVSPSRLQQAEVERLAEDCRLAYVALTRARYRTYVGWGAVGATNGAPQGAAYSALAYLLADLPALDATPVAERASLVAQHFLADCDRYDAVVRSLVAESDDRMAVEVVDSTLIDVVVRGSAAPPVPSFAARTLPAEPPLRTRFDTYVISSFTHLTAGSHAAPADVSRDVDDVRVPHVRVDELPPSDFRTFPAGRRAGTVLHALFEGSRVDDTLDVLRTRAAVQLTRNQLVPDEEDPRVDATARMIRAVFETPMAPWPVTLANVSPERVRHEWQFLLPFASADTAAVRQSMARCFEQFGGVEGARYATRLRTLGTGRVHGFLTGFVDLVFEHRGQWYVVDWKSNQLGADFAAYERGALQSVMDASHYTLQAHLYLVALHRYLRVRLPGYDYDRHIGGAAYAFLRGFANGPSDTGLGWYTDRPSRALIEALSAVMDGAPQGAA
jgi:exodeoxyribonuclease V beta subunit